MSTEDERAAQRGRWRQALAAAAAVRRNARYHRKPPRLKAGMLRAAPATNPQASGPPPGRAADSRKDHLMATLKQVGDAVRKRLAAARSAGTLPDARYNVRVSNSRKNGAAVNITIEGHERLILAYARFCGGQVESLADVADEFFSEWREAEGEALIAKVDAIAGRDKYEPALGGVTKFGTLLISARVTGWTHITSGGAA